MVFNGLVCLIKGLKPEDFFWEEVPRCVFPHLKRANFSLEWDFFEQKPKYLQVEKRHFLRVPTIFNSQTVYDTYETNKKWNKNLRVNLIVIEIAPWNDVFTLTKYFSQKQFFPIFNFLRFSMTFNSGTAYDTCETNKNLHRNLRVNLRVFKIAPWNGVCPLIKYSTEKQLIYIYHQVLRAALSKSEEITTINPWRKT